MVSLRQPKNKKPLYYYKKKMRCGLLKWWIFESIFKKLETAMGQSIDAQSQGDSEYVKAVYKLVAND